MSTLYFTATDATHGTEVWTSDGTAAGTQLLDDINSSTDAYDYGPHRFAEFGGRTYFVDKASAYGGYDLWSTDGTAANTSRLVDISPGDDLYGASIWTDFTTINDHLVFTASTASTGNELWITDGTSSGTMLLKDINFGNQSSSPEGLTEYDGSFYFTAMGGIWTTDGTTAGTTAFKYLSSSSGSGVHSFTPFLDGMVFSGRNSMFNTELWVTYGSDATTQMLLDINPGNNAASGPTQYTQIGDMLYFAAIDATHGQELWVSDGSSAGTHMVKDINPGGDAGIWQNMTVYRDNLYFIADDGTHGRELWTSDGTAAGTQMVMDINPGAADGPADVALTVFNDALVFNANDGTHGAETWISDGTAAGTHMFSDMVAGSGGSNPGNYTPMDGKLYFSANDGTNGTELWVSDGTTANTMMLKDIYPGSQVTTPNSSAPETLTVINDSRFTTGNDSYTLNSVGERIDALGGDDTITGSNSADYIMGNDGADILNSLGGNDVLIGGAGADQLYGGDGNDVLDGGSLTASEIDVLYGGTGNDTYIVNSIFTALDVVYEGGSFPGGAGDIDTIISKGSFFWDYYNVGEVLNISPSAASGAVMVSGRGDSVMNGNDTGNFLLTYGGSNTVNPGAGIDVIGLGLYDLGKSFNGTNTVVVTKGDDTNYIYDFESGTDKVDISDYGYYASGSQIVDYNVVDTEWGCYIYLGTVDGQNEFLAFDTLQAADLAAGDFIV